MKKLLLLVLLSYMVCINAQTEQRDMSRITIHAIVPPYANIPQAPHDLLESKISQIITENGIEDNEYGVRFVLTAKVNVVSKDIVAGAPQRISQKLDITLILGDIVEDKVFSRKTISVAGAGVSEEKAFIEAFKNIKPSNKDISQFMQDGKKKILDFYQIYCEDIIAEAKEMAKHNQYEQAIMMLSSMPYVNSKCFSKSISAIDTIYQQMIAVRGEELLQKAQNVWMVNPTRDGADEASRYLLQINHSAPCQTEVSKLLTQIGEKMNEIDQREWQHEMQMYQDSIDRERQEWDFQMQIYADEVERDNRQWEQSVREYEESVKTQRLYIKAVRDVAIEQARNQPKEMNYYRINYPKIYSW